MFNQTNFDLHHADYMARTAKVNREGWMTEGVAYAVALNDRERRSFVQRMRRLFSETLTGLGVRSKGTTTAHVTLPATVGYGPTIQGVATLDMRANRRTR